MKSLQRAWWTAKAVGWDNLPRRLLQEWRIRTGWLQRRTHPDRYRDTAFRAECPITIDEQVDRWRERANRFFSIPNARQLRDVADDPLWAEQVTSICEQALAGEYPFFSRWTGQLGWPPDFNRDPVHRIDWPVGEHWTKTARSGPPRHDIKLVWEPNRFTLAWHLARAYRRSGDPRWAEAFWAMFDAWIEQNPPQLTVAWGCGQETAFRLMAMLTGAFATLDSKHATPARLHALTRFAWQAGYRIEANINYARAQENNHALSEALGLWTVGLLFDEFPRAARWKAHGRRVLAAECKRQTYDDGSFVQHSVTYHRVMLDDLIWCIRLGQINRDPMLDIVLDRFRRAVDWYGQMIDPISGRAPNYGSNDGANVLPLTCGDYLDHRPTLQAAHIIAYGKPAMEAGPWNEKALWLCDRESLGTEHQPIQRETSWSAPIGGYHILRGPNSWLMTRCGRYKDRPHQCDMLHVDLWYMGVNVLRDAGSFMYYHEDPRWQHYFHSTAAHNTIQIDGVDQMTKGPRFLWFHWPSGRVLKRLDDDQYANILFQNFSYHRLNPTVQHFREIDRDGDDYIIHDNVQSASAHDIRLTWRTAELDWRPDEQTPNTWLAKLGKTTLQLRIECNHPMEAKWVCGDEKMPEGWESLYYAEKQAVPSLVATVSEQSAVDLKTTITCRVR